MARHHGRALLRATVILGFIALGAPALAQPLTTLYRFPGGANGNFPRGGVAMDTSGNLYGTTRYDGNCSTCGVIYKLTKPAAGSTTWTYQVMHQFLLSGGGIDPISPLTSFNNVLYGTAAGGGDPACGCGIDIQHHARARTRFCTPSILLCRASSSVSGRRAPPRSAGC